MCNRIVFTVNISCFRTVQQDADIGTHRPTDSRHSLFAKMLPLTEEYSTTRVDESFQIEYKDVMVYLLIIYISQRQQRSTSMLVLLFSYDQLATVPNFSPDMKHYSCKKKGCCSAVLQAIRRSGS